MRPHPDVVPGGDPVFAPLTLPLPLEDHLAVEDRHLAGAVADGVDAQVEAEHPDCNSIERRRLAHRRLRRDLRFHSAIGANRSRRQLTQRACHRPGSVEFAAVRQELQRDRHLPCICQGIGIGAGARAAA